MNSKNSTLMMTKSLISFLIFAGVFLEFEAGRRVKRIVGGEEMKDNEIKYQASLRVFDQHVCSGTLISSRHILTAAHCIAGLGFTPPFEELTVVTGTKRLSDIKNSRSIFNISWNEKFVNGLGDTGYNKNDVAVITLVDEINFDDTQAAILLPESPIVDGSTGIVCGWGRLDPFNPYLSKTLHKMTTRLATRQTCQAHQNYPLSEGQICGFTKKNTGICKGDSGGSLVVDDRIVGITSWTMNCATGIDVYTDVYEHLGFIKETMAQNAARSKPKNRGPGSK